MDSYVSSHLQKVKSESMMSQLGQWFWHVLSYLQYYKNPEKAKRDVQNLLQHYRGLQPKVETFGIKLVLYYLIHFCLYNNRLCSFVLTVFNDGASKQLLCLGGTIPVHYKGTPLFMCSLKWNNPLLDLLGSDYNIPVALWLLETHPVNAPMVFVRPTSDMRLRISKHVDHNGKVYMPYLHVWSAVS
jgi:ESCRT-I complex subunit TSG101